MTTTPADEIKAIARIIALLDKLDPGAQTRAVRYLTDRYREQPTEEAR